MSSLVWSYAKFTSKTSKCQTHSAVIFFFLYCLLTNYSFRNHFLLKGMNLQWAMGYMFSLCLFLSSLRIKVTGDRQERRLFQHLICLSRHPQADISEMLLRPGHGRAEPGVIMQDLFTRLLGKWWEEACVSWLGDRGLQGKEGQPQNSLLRTQSVSPERG